MTYTLSNKRLAAYAAAGAAVMGTAGVAQADFTGYYDHSNWTFSTGSDAAVTGATATFLEITGANGGFFDVATYTIAAQAGGLVSFHYNYLSTDVGNWDNAGFYLNGALIQLVNNAGQGASFTFSTTVNAGDVIGFFVRSMDGGFGPGILQVDQFSAPTVVIPEPSAAILLALGTVGGSLAMRRRRRGENN